VPKGIFFNFTTLILRSNLGQLSLNDEKTFKNKKGK